MTDHAARDESASAPPAAQSAAVEPERTSSGEEDRPFPHPGPAGPPPEAAEYEVSDREASEEEEEEEDGLSGRTLEDEPVTSAGAVEELVGAGEEEIEMDWYILKVQSNRERSIAEALERKMAVEGLGRYFEQAIVPTEKVTEFKGGKKRVAWFAVRETSGIGDFTGAAGKPTPMLSHEVARIVRKEEEITTEEPKLDIKFSEGDRVKIKEGNFENFEGEVSAVDEASGRVTVMINIFGRSTPVELEYWHLEAV
jgi:transcriptional antiterminator NusG